MNCYLCYLETRASTRPALSICQACSVGVCERHLIAVVIKPVIGMSTTLQRRRVFCIHCAESAISSSPPVQQKDLRKWSHMGWWRWFWNTRRGDLPEPEEAVVIAERWLQRRHPLS
jgi:hypothetical protein